MKLAFFDEVEAPDGGLVVVDGGIHGVQGHTLAVEAGGAARWERRLDGLMPSGVAGSGTDHLAAEDRARLDDWARAAWDLAGDGGRRSFFAPVENGPPRWVWAVVVRRGADERALEGSAIAPSHAPHELAPEIASLLAFVIARVDGLAAALR